MFYNEGQKGCGARRERTWRRTELGGIEGGELESGYIMWGKQSVFNKRKKLKVDKGG